MIRGRKSNANGSGYKRAYCRRVDEGPRLWPYACLFLFALLTLYLLGILFVAPSIQQDTQMGVARTLERAGHHGFSVSADGQEVLIIGEGSKKTQQALNKLAYNAHCDTWAGEFVCPTNIRAMLQEEEPPSGVAEIQMSKLEASKKPTVAGSQLPIIEAPSSQIGETPLEPSSTRKTETHVSFLFNSNGEKISLKGLAPVALGQDWASDNARLAFDHVDNQLSITDGIGSEHYSWAVTHAIKVLSHLERGHAVWMDRKLSIWGDVLKKDEQRLRELFSRGGKPELRDELYLNIIETNVIETKDNDCNDSFNSLLATPSILFDTGSAEISDKSHDILVTVAQNLESCAFILNINGHADSTGSSALNKKLSLARAQSVVDALAVLGADISRTKAQGYGSSKPVASNKDSSGRAKNRRTEIHPAELL